jgi:branched-chain amino acid transport system substrate-binding protein
MNIGILFPSSNMHPGIGFDFVDGIKTFLKKEQLIGDIRISADTVGFGQSEKEVYEKAQKLLLIDGVDVLIAYIDLRVTEILQPLLFSSGKLLIIVNAGANYPHNWVPQPNIIYLTLHHGFCCRMTGDKAGDAPEKNAALATTFYDCGYLQSAALINSFLERGGYFAYNYINNQKYDAGFEIGALTQFLAANIPTQKLLCLFDSMPANLFYDRLAAYEKAKELSLYVSPMMLTETALGGKVWPFSIQGYSPWLPTIDTSENTSFLSFYKEQTKRNASLFSVQGWEAGMLVQAILSQFKNDTTDSTAIVENLSTVSFNSPRGTIAMDATTNHITAPLYYCSVQKGSGKMEMSVVKETAEQWAAFTSIPITGVSSGWMNTYLCY